MSKAGLRTGSFGDKISPSPSDSSPDRELDYQPERREINKVEQVDFSAYDYTEEESRSIVRKLDWHILPFIWWGYLFNSLDRNNLSNAKSDGMTVDLNFPPDGYRTLLSIFYIPFTTLVIPAVFLTRKIGPRYTIPGYMLGWGAMAMINAAAGNFAGCTIIRVLLGAFEAGFAPSLIFYLTTFYTRGELGKRIAVFYSTNALSGSFSGLIAYGVFQMNTKLYGWQILFLIEGAFTVGFAVLTALFLPWSTAQAKFLTPREREVARLRVLRDSSQATGTVVQTSTFFAPLQDPWFYLYASIALCYGVAASVSGNFMTQIIGRFHYSVVKTNLFTVAPFAFGALMMLLTAWSSDRQRERGYHLVSALVLVFIGCIILVAVPVTSVKVGYFAVFLVTGGAQTPSCIFHSWHQSNDPSEDGRAFKIGALSFLANTGGIVSANIFLDKWSPAYRIPLAITAAIEGLGIVLILIQRTRMSLDNKRRNKEQGVNWSSIDVPTEALREGPSNPLFRHFC